NWTGFINGLADYVNNTTKTFTTYWRLNWGSSVFHFLSASETFSSIHSNTTNHVVTKVRGYFYSKVPFAPWHSLVRYLECVVKRREFAVGKFNVDYRSQYLTNNTCIFHFSGSLTIERFSTGNNFDQLGCNSGLSHLIHFKR